MITIVAEPGLGKSRLVQAFSGWIDAREELVTWRQGRCRPYGGSIAFEALAEIVRAQTEILNSDESSVAQQKLNDTITALVTATGRTGRASWMVARLAPLVGLPASEAAPEELFAAWRSFLEELARAGPLVLVVEDLHWAEASLLSFLDHLLDRVIAVPLIIVATARPELLDDAPHVDGQKPTSHHAHSLPVA